VVYFYYLAGYGKYTKQPKRGKTAFFVATVIYNFTRTPALHRGFGARAIMSFVKLGSLGYFLPLPRYKPLWCKWKSLFTKNSDGHF